METPMPRQERERTKALARSALGLLDVLGKLESQEGVILDGVVRAEEMKKIGELKKRLGNS